MKYDTPRNAAEVGKRALILGYFLSAFRLKGQEDRAFAVMVKTAEDALLPSDREILFRGDWSDELQRDLMWQAEGLTVLLWTAGYGKFPRADEMVAPESVVWQLNKMGADPAAWLGRFTLRQTEQIVAESEAVELWFWRVRDALLAGSGQFSTGAEEAISGAVGRGVVAEDELSGGDLVAFGRPVHLLARRELQLLEEITRERIRAFRWIWRDFDDWWAPNLDT